jgi:hypothetical protein
MFKLLGLQLLKPMKFQIFSTDGAHCAQNFKYMCSGFYLESVSDQSEFMVLFMVLNLPVTTFGLDLFSGAYLTKLGAPPG